LELFFLGTGAGMPTKQRNVTSIALNLLVERDSFWLFDCGEGTQHQILRSPVKLSKTDKIFITHLHGDHLYGLPGLLSSRAYSGGEGPLTIYGPIGIQSYVEQCLAISESRISYEMSFVEIEQAGVIWEDDKFRIEVAELQHRIACFGYRIIELDQPGKLNADKCHEMNIPPGPIYGQLKKGNKVQLPDGRWVDGQDYLEPAISGRVVTILGDTLYCPGAILLAQDADVLVHEATFAAERQDLAMQYHHATSIDAARVAQEANVIDLIMTHISSRYQEQDTDVLLEEAKKIHDNSFIASDFYCFPVKRKKPL
jgi:ribonuclease Z